MNRKTARELLLEGKLPHEITKSIGISYNSVCKARRKLGLPPFKAGRKPGKNALLARRLKQQGLSYKSIGLILGVTRQGAYRYVMITKNDQPRLCSKCGTDRGTLHHHHLTYEDNNHWEFLCASCHAREHS